MKRGEIPIGVHASDDVHRRAGQGAVLAGGGVGGDFTGYVVDYGTEPDQKAPYFTLRDVRGRWRGGAARRAGRRDLRRPRAADRARRSGASGGATTARMVRIDRCLIDANWGQSTDVVYQFCRQSGSRRRAAQPRPLRRRVEHPVQRVQAEARRSRRAQLAHPEHRPAHRAARRVRHELLEELRARPAGGADGRSGLPVAVRPQRSGTGCSPST
jgi:hypothetical protein